MLGGLLLLMVREDVEIGGRRDSAYGGGSELVRSRGKRKGKGRGVSQHIAVLRHQESAM